MGKYYTDNNGCYIKDTDTSTPPSGFVELTEQEHEDAMSNELKTLEAESIAKAANDSDLRKNSLAALGAVLTDTEVDTLAQALGWEERLEQDIPKKPKGKKAQK